MSVLKQSDYETQLIEDIAGFEHDPLGYVLYAFPWGEGDLKGKSGPREWQARILDKIGELLKQGSITVEEAIQIAIASGHGIGKAKSANTIMPTPFGDKRLADIKPGDFVYGSDGKPTRVLATKYHESRPTYKVVFDDGSFVLADENHDWSVRGRQERRKGDESFRTMSTKEILDAGVKRANGIGQARQWEIPVQVAVEGTIKASSAYAVGVWLGDGHATAGRYSKPDMEVVEHLESLGHKVGLNKEPDLARTIFGLCVELRRLGLINCRSYERFIPDECYQWLAEDRAELLRGLLDTDGECQKNGTIIFSSSSEALSRGVQRLARSLGCKVNEPRIKEAYLNGVRHRDCYRITINAPRDLQPFYIKRKGERVLPECQGRYLSRFIDKIEYVGMMPTICIEVEAADSLYLANDYIVTHNSALVAFVILWAMSTKEDTRGVVTANTENQLKTKTWAELAKWHRLAINEHWFHYTATALFSADKSHEKTWRIDMVAWSIANTEAFAGLHNEGKRVLLIFDEASAIPDLIWEVSEGVLTDENTEILWLCFGNPTRNTGRFRQAFGKFKHRWYNEQIDSRSVDGTNKAQIEKWIEDYGEDSDFVKVRVRGVFPSASSLQFIPSDLILRGQKQEAMSNIGDPLILALDIARGGDDMCVFWFRRGLDAQSIKPIKIPGSEVRDSMKLVSFAVNLITQHKPDAFFFDGTGVGGPVGDRIKQLGFRVFEVQFGSSSPDPRYGNFRAYMYGRLKEWLEAGGAIDSDTTLETDLSSLEYYHNAKDQLFLESKESMKKRGLASPDCFVAGTMISTPEGDRPIETLRLGDLISTPMGIRTVIATQESEDCELTTARFSNGKTLAGKGKHKIFTWNRGWTRLDSLAMTDELEINDKLRNLLWMCQRKLSTMGNPIGFKALVDIISPTKKMCRKDFFIGGFGSIIMGQFQSAIKSITKIMIGQITRLEILSSPFLANISASTCWTECETHKRGPRILSIFAREGQRQQAGMEVQKALSGTASMAKKPGRTERPTKGTALFAVMFLRRTLIEQGDVRILANKRRHFNATKLRLQYVFTVIKSLLTTALESRRVVLDSVVTVTEPKPVKFYNLTLDQDNVYFANGILVANCGDALAMTFAFQVAPRNLGPGFGGNLKSDYDPFR